MPSRRPVRWQLRVLVTTVCGLLLLGSGVTLLAIHASSRTLDSLTLVLGPAMDTNSRLLQEMTDADASLRSFLSTGEQDRLGPYREAESRVIGTRAALRRLLERPDISADDKRDYVRMQTAQDLGAAAWWSYADLAYRHALAGGSIDRAAGRTLFERFRVANTELGQHLRAGRDALRDSSRAGLTQVTLVVLLTSAVALAGGLLMARRTAWSLTVPIARLQDVVRRTQAGETNLPADERRGAREVRELAAAFNSLTSHNERLVAEQAEALRLHQVALEVEREIREASTAQEALDAVCRSLGPAMAAQRAVVATVDDTGHVSRGAQWHAGDLPDFPPDTSPYAAPVAKRLWRESAHLAVSDVLTGGLAEERWVSAFRAEAGARALLVVPFGLAERALGAICVTTDEGPRRWTSAEIAMMHHVAAFLAHTIAQVEYRAHQAEYVARLERLDQQKTDFLATISHELRTPLTSINGYLELLLDGAGGEVTPTQRNMIDIVVRNSDRLRGLIEDVLVMNRIEAGGLPLHGQDVSVPALVRQTVEDLLPLADKGAVRLEVEIDEDAPSTVFGDRTYLQRALVNVIANAIKFTPGGGRVHVAHAADPDTGEITVTCRDTGIGIPEQDLDQLATGFFRAGNATSSAIPGTGLGLAIVKAILAAHDGRLAVESVEGHGTTITLLLPAVRVPADRS